MSEFGGRQDRWEMLVDEVDAAIQGIRKGVGADFRERLRVIV